VDVRDETDLHATLSVCDGYSPTAPPAGFLRPRLKIGVDGPGVDPRGRREDGGRPVGVGRSGAGARSG
jgi:hypothetical protein